MPYGNNNSYGNQYPRNNTGGGQRSPGGGPASRSQRENTDGQLLFNEMAGKALDFSYWGAYANVAILTAAPGSPMDWSMKKSSANRVTCTLSFASLSELLDIVEEVKDSLKNSGSFTPAAFRVGAKRDTIIQIDNGSSIKQQAGIYIVIYKNVDQSGRSGSYEFYPFSATRVIREYNSASGVMKEDISKIGQFKKFYRLVKAATEAFTMAQSHVISSAGRNDRMKQQVALAAMAMKMGVDLNAEYEKLRSSSSSQSSYGSGGGSNAYNGNRGGGYGNRRSYGGGGNYGGNSYQPTAPQTQSSAPPITLDTPVDLSALDLSNLNTVDLDRFK